MAGAEQVAVAQLGARMHYAVPRILHGMGMLSRLYTDICAIKGWPRLLRHLPRVLHPNGMKRLLGRVPHGIPPDRITSYTSLGWQYAQKRAAARTASELTSVHLWAGRTLGKFIIQNGLDDTTGTYTFNSAGLEILQFAQTRGLQTAMEQTIVPKYVERRLLAEEHDLHPGWQPAPQENRFADEFAEREREEWGLSNVILCGSVFVRDGIVACGGSLDKCVVVPYGVDVPINAPKPPRRQRPFRVLTIGSAGLRKGTPYVLEAARLLNGKAQFRMIGSVAISERARRELAAHVEVMGYVPRTEIWRHYLWADVFLLPSICEGSATVCYEALGSGVPVICTPNTGAIIRDGLEGFVVPIRDPLAIAEKIELLASDEDLHQKMSQRARVRAEQEGSVEAYAKRLARVMRRGKVVV